MLSSVLIVAAFLVGSEVAARSVDEKGDASKGYTCLYNGTEYKEGEELPTRGNCLRCVCKEGFTEPGIDHCAIIDCPDDWKSDCTPVYEKGECCPVLWNCSVSSGVVPLVVPFSPAKCDCDWRFYKHYSVKNCEPVYENGSCCPVRFDCPEKVQKDQSVCHYKGKTYQLREEIVDPSLCRNCMCGPGFDGTPEINCAEDGYCSFDPDPRLRDPRCYEVYEDGACCPSGIKCDTDDGVNKTAEPVCILDGKVYHYGQKMYPEGKPCVTCYCNEKWSGLHGSTCHTTECNIEIGLKYLERGCLPIYHETTCCPIEYHCKTGEEEIIPSTKSLLPDADGKDEKNKCKFDDKAYSVGDVLYIKHPTHCVTCTCRTPPDFTCIHKRCPRPPNNDYINCEANYKPGECCPTYECVQEKPSATCDPVKCPESCIAVTYPNGCPVCDCQGLLCALPKCAPECTLEYDSAPGSCPTCKCPNDSPSERPSCDPVQCGPQCHKGIGSNGCPMCICGPLCSIPECGQGCHVEKYAFEGQCPRCICPDIAPLALATVQAPQYRCAPVKCSPNCREVEGPNGCPMCDCGPLCSPPKCDPGCRAETVPSAGPCPGCICDRIPQIIQCAPVKCEGNCYEVRVPNGCPMCMCDDLLCSPPKCPAGCYVNNDVPPGSCPDCKCPPTIPLNRPMCDPVKCGPQCREGISPQGCPICICGPLCYPPQCEPGCRVQFQVPEGQCPGCECSGGDGKPGQEMQIRCGLVKCPSMCKEAIGENGCPTCVCEILCSPPKCDPGCRLQHTSPYSPCPECVCDPLPEVASIPCSPPKCDEPGCRINYDAYPCPECVCDDRQVPPQVACSPPKCDEPGCRIDYTTQPCPSCRCDQQQVPSIPCSPPKCDEPGCRINYNAWPCPECVCDDRQVPPQVACSPPKCDEPGCRIDYTTQPCPSCRCDQQQVPSIPCSPPKCDEPGCKINYNAWPCPECVCDDRRIPPQVACTPPKCDQPGCRIDYTTQPCPSCACSGGRVADIPCSPPRCDEPGCRIDYSAKPCPACVCDGRQGGIPIPCSPPKCDDPGCRIDYTTQPCPSCVCDGGQVLDVACSPPKCTDPGCRIDYSKKPCPECVCDGNRGIPIRCSPPICNEPGCRVDFTAYPCPACVCDAPKISCSMPKCDGPGCRINYRSKPCPECVCDSGYVPFIACSMPQCSPDCQVDYNAKPCPACSCSYSRSARQIACSMPRCPRGCSIDYSTRPCPSCNCNNNNNRINPQIACSPPRCGPGCEINYNTRPCPSCVCGRGGYGRPW